MSKLPVKLVVMKVRAVYILDNRASYVPKLADRREASVEYISVDLRLVHSLRIHALMSPPHTSQWRGA
jgi:hypothetical protein